MRRGLAAAAALAAALLCGGCRVDTSVGIDAKADGSGQVRVEVRLDADAAKQVGDLSEQLRVEDLRDAGWTVTGPTKVEEGGVEVVATKPFATPDGAGDAMDEISGEDGPFRNFDLELDRSFLRSEAAFAGTVDLEGGIEGFSDDALKERLGGQPLGFDPAELEGRLGTALNRIFRFQVAVRLPGDVEANAPVTTGNGAVWTPQLGERVTLEATSTKANTGRLVLAAIALVTGVLFAVIVALHLRRALRRRGRGTGPPDPADYQGA